MNIYHNICTIKTFSGYKINTNQSYLYTHTQVLLYMHVHFVCTDKQSLVLFIKYFRAFFRYLALFSHSFLRIFNVMGKNSRFFFNSFTLQSSMLFNIIYLIFKSPWAFSNMLWKKIFFNFPIP